jgi:hypothetical protein
VLAELGRPGRPPRGTSSSSTNVRTIASPSQRVLAERLGKSEACVSSILNERDNGI